MAGAAASAVRAEARNTAGMRLLRMNQIPDLRDQRLIGAHCVRNLLRRDIAESSS
jgi:hypothetical protein